MSEQRYVRYFHELDAWTEYWDLYHPETHGRFYFGDGEMEAGLLRRFLPREHVPPPTKAWKRMALDQGTPEQFAQTVRDPEVAPAILEVDGLVAGLFAEHFGDAADPEIQADYLQAIVHFGADQLPPAGERDARIAKDDPRKLTAGRHRIRDDVMWFMWALELEAAQMLAGADHGSDYRSLLLAGVAIGSAADFAWRGHRRTRREYAADVATSQLLYARGTRWAADFDASAEEVHALYRIREWGSED